MNRNRIAVLFWWPLLLTSFSASAMDLSLVYDRKPDFVFAITSTDHSRGELLEKASSKNILAYNINSESSVDVKESCMRNVKMRLDGKWVRVAKVPLPDVLYDYAGFKNDRDKKEAMRALKEQLAAVKTLFINPDKEMETVNDKILFAKIMQTHNVPHPETIEFSKRNLRAMLARHDILYLKPVKGSRGYGIIVVEKTTIKKTSVYSVTYKFQKNGAWHTDTERNLSLRKLRKKIRAVQERLNRHRAKYLIQQGIKTYRYKNQHQTDFRVNLQRGDDGRLLCSGILNRVGGNGSQGGRSAAWQAVLADFTATYGGDADVIIDRVVKIATATQRALEKYTQRTMGDLGIDVVIDVDGNAYVVEANHKGGFARYHLKKNPLVDSLYGLPPYYQESIKLDNDREEHLLAYARFLSERSWW